jgi:hypothetical protein
MNNKGTLNQIQRMRGIETKGTTGLGMLEMKGTIHLEMLKTRGTKMLGWAHGSCLHRVRGHCYRHSEKMNSTTFF